MRLFKVARARIRRARKRALRVPKQFRFHQVLRDRRAIDRHHLGLRTPARHVNRARDHLFTGSGLARDQRRRLPRPNQADQRMQIAHRLAIADQKIRPRLAPRARPWSLPHHRAQRFRGLHPGQVMEHGRRPYQRLVEHRFLVVNNHRQRHRCPVSLR